MGRYFYGLNTNKSKNKGTKAVKNNSNSVSQKSDIKRLASLEGLEVNMKRVKQILFGIIIAITIAIVTTMCTSCSALGQTQSSSTEVDDEVFIDSSVNMLNNVRQLVKTGDASGLKCVEPSLQFVVSDIITDIQSEEFYVTHNACYYQVNSYMFRFQFNEYGVVESYIKYVLEG